MILPSSQKCSGQTNHTPTNDRVDSSTDVPVRTMPRKGIGPAVASLCSPVETKPAIVIIDGEQRRKAKKWASSDIVTFAACYLHVERSPRQASAQQSVWAKSKGFRSQQTTHQPYHVCNSPGKLLRTRRQSQHCQSSRNNCQLSRISDALTDAKSGFLRFWVRRRIFPVCVPVHIPTKTPPRTRIRDIVWGS